MDATYSRSLNKLDYILLDVVIVGGTDTAKICNQSIIILEREIFDPETKNRFIRSFPNC